MEGVALALLVAITICAISTALLLLRRLTTVRTKLKALTEMAVTTAGTPSGPASETTPKDKVEDLRMALGALQEGYRALQAGLGLEKERLTAILSTMDAGVFFLDKERQVGRLNRSADKLFAVAGAAAVCRPFIAVVHDHEMDSMAQRCIDTSQEQTGVVRLAGGEQHVKVTAVPLGAGALVLVQDLTDAKRLEKVRQDFVANVSHELRTPVASLKALVETLQEGVPNKKTAADFLVRMHVETDKLAQMVTELGELSRVESGRVSLKLEPVDLTRIAGRVAERLRAQAERAQITITVEAAADLPCALADEDRIEQVLVNLVHNAIKFTPQNGWITISSKPDGNGVLTSVSDTGIGIPADDLPRIFERFYKVDKSRSGGGTGLGLAIAKHIVQAHSGSIWVESTEGKGSTFFFTLPMDTSLTKV